MKRISAFCLALLLLCALVLPVGATEVTVLINGTEPEFDVPPCIIGDRTMVPMRAVFTALGASVEWVEEQQLVLATHGVKIIAMRIGAYSFTVTDALTGVSETVALDVPAQIVNDRTLIPLRAVSTALGKTVSWDGTISTAYIDG